MKTRIKEAIDYWNKQDESIRPLAFNQAKIAEIISLLKGKAKKEAEEYYSQIKNNC